MSELYLFNDTETTGFAKSGNMIQLEQARVCQIALLLTDDAGCSLVEFSALIKPDGLWTVGEGAQKVHGFSTEQCQAHGLNHGGVMQLWRSLSEMSSLHIAHNSDFDAKMMKIEEAYYNADRKPEKHIATKKDWFCTMKPNTHICNGKWPKLDEALKYFTGRELGSFAHDAMYDVKACRDIFFAMRKMAAA